MYIHICNIELHLIYSVYLFSRVMLTVLNLFNDTQYIFLLTVISGTRTRTGAFNVVWP